MHVCCQAVICRGSKRTGHFVLPVQLIAKSGPQGAGWDVRKHCLACTNCLIRSPRRTVCCPARTGPNWRLRSCRVTVPDRDTHAATLLTKSNDTHKLRQQATTRAAVPPAYRCQHSSSVTGQSRFQSSQKQLQHHHFSCPQSQGQRNLSRLQSSRRLLHYQQQ